MIDKEEIEQVNTPNEVMQHKVKEIIFTLINITLAYLGIRLFLAAGGGLLMTILTVGFCISVMLYLKSKKLTLTKIHWLYLAYVLLLSLSVALHENKILQMVNIWFLAISLTYWLLVLVGARKNGRLDKHIFYDLLDGLIIRPVTFEGRETSDAIFLDEDDRPVYKFKNSYFSKIVIGLAISAPLLLLVLGLLVNADELFAKMVSAIFSFSFAELGKNLLILLGAVPLGLYLVRLVNQNLKAKKIAHAPVKPIPHANLVFMTIVSVFIAIYALFLGASIVTCLKLTAASANYEVVAAARNGFFQLLVVALINVLMFFMVKGLSENTKPIRLALTLIGLETLGIIISALVKMLLYISHFGLTILRFNTSIFMLILFVCVLIFIFALWQNFNYTRLTAVFVAVCLLALSFNNSGNMIANYNFQQFSIGKIAEFDARILNEIGVEAVPTALEIYQKTDDERLKEQVKMYLIASQDKIANQSKMITMQRLQADKNIKALFQ
jgi:hypothetical protein